jgi:hypothetical protein
MIVFGSGWTWQNGHICHCCESGLVYRWRGESTCQCGAPVPVHAQTFQRWIRRDLKRAAIDRDLRALPESLDQRPEDPELARSAPTPRPQSN